MLANLDAATPSGRELPYTLPNAVGFLSLAGYDEGMVALSPSAGPTITFWGAARTVTGTMHLIEAGGEQVLLDCGLYLERRGEGRLRNRTFPFDPYRVKAVVLSHAHIDHCGNLPNLVRQGFRGPIYCTPPTRDLLTLMLADSARIQESDALHANMGRQQDEPWVEALYGKADVQRTLDLVEVVPYGHTQAINDSIDFRLVDAGHVLGSAMVAVRIAWGGRECSLTFTGDVGRPGMPLLCDPSPVPPADVVVCESTYGGQRHEPVERMAEALRVTVAQTLARGGKVLVPAFSLGRSQTVVHFLQRMMSQNRLPSAPIFVDSPLAADIAQLYRQHPDYLSAETVRQLGESANFLEAPQLHYARTLEESKQLNAFRDPCIIVASSGMCEGGRVLHHLKHSIDDPRCSIVLVSYQAPDSLGYRLLERKPTVRFMGRDWNKWADIVVLKGFSGHADQDGLVSALAPLSGRARKVRLVHGEPEAADSVAKELRATGFADVGVAEPGESLDLMV